MASKHKLNTTVQMQVRLRESLRRQLEQAATDHSRSMNAEIVARLAASFVTYDQQKIMMDLIAHTIEKLELIEFRALTEEGYLGQQAQAQARQTEEAGGTLCQRPPAKDPP